MLRPWVFPQDTGLGVEGIDGVRMWLSPQAAGTGLEHNALVLAQERGLMVGREQLPHCLTLVGQPLPKRGPRTPTRWPSLAPH